MFSTSWKCYTYTFTNIDFIWLIVVNYCPCTGKQLKIPSIFIQVTILEESEVCWLIESCLTMISWWIWKMWMSILYLLRNFSWTIIEIRRSLNKINEYLIFTRHDHKEIFDDIWVYMKCSSTKKGFPDILLRQKNIASFYYILYPLPDSNMTHFSSMFPFGNIVWMTSV